MHIIVRVFPQVPFRIMLMSSYSQQHQAEFEKLVKERNVLEASQKKLLKQYEDLRSRCVRYRSRTP